MPRRKKLSKQTLIKNWLQANPKVTWSLIVVVLILCYLPVHAFRIYADEHKFYQTRSAIDTVYSKVSTQLGTPDDLKSTNSCYKDSGLVESHVSCTVETDFIYSTANQNQANILMSNVQKSIAATHRFRVKGGLAKSLSNDLVYDTYYHDALDNYRGPHDIACTVKYSFDSLDEVDLSWRDQSLKPLEIFFACSGPSAKAVY